MIGELDQEQIEHLLRSQMIGHLGCSAEGRTYVVPINYVYDGESIYGYSLEGLKLRLMRLNPEVCFQVDHIQQFSNWQSVIAWGTFEELAGEEAGKTLQMFAQQSLTGIASGKSIHRLISEDRSRFVLYRILLSEKHGRYETPSEATYDPSRRRMQ